MKQESILAWLILTGFRKVPSICKVAPNTNKYHIQDVNRAGGLWDSAELDRGGLNNRSCSTVLNKTIGEVIDEHDIMNHNGKFTDAAKESILRLLVVLETLLLIQDNFIKR